MSVASWLLGVKSFIIGLIQRKSKDIVQSKEKEERSTVNIGLQVDLTYKSTVKFWIRPTAVVHYLLQ